MIEWKLKCFVSGSGKSEVQITYSKGTPQLQAAFYAEWLKLKKLPREKWVRPSAAKLNKAPKGGFRDYFEIRFFANNIEQRPIGYFCPENDEFIILVWATEKGKLIPESWRTKADRNRKAIQTDGGRTHVKDFKFD